MFDTRFFETHNTQLNTVLDCAVRLNPILFYDDDFGFEGNFTYGELYQLGLSNYSQGMYKFCFVLDDFVVKIPYRERYIMDEDLREFVKEDMTRDNCDLEFECYQRAKQHGVESFFAETYSVGHHIVLQEKADILADEIEDECPELYQQYGIRYDAARDVVENPSPYSEEIAQLFNFILPYGAQPLVIELFCQQHTEDELVRLVEFLKEEQIDDLQARNMGVFNGKVKFFDFGGV